MPDSTFDATEAARSVLRAAPTGALGTLDAEGNPFVSFVTVATDQDGAPLCLLSKLAVHTRNLDRDGRASLLLVAPGGEDGDPLAGARITITGSCTRVTGDAEVARARGRFLARHPEAEGYAAFTDFGFFRMRVHEAHLVAGFGRITRVARDELLTDADLAADFAEAEPDILAHLNDDHAATLGLYAGKLLGQPAGDWTAVGADADGIDLAGPSIVRLGYGSRVTSVAAVRVALARLADAARAR